MSIPNKSNWDAIVVGGGLVGLAIGYGLSRIGVSTLLLDGADTAIRAARGNFGLIWVQGKGAYFEPYADWTMRSSKLWPKLTAELDDSDSPPLGFYQTGGLNICLSEDEMQKCKDKLECLQTHQNGRFEFEMLDRNELLGILPGLGSKVVGAAFCPHDGHVNPLYLMRALQTGLYKNNGFFSSNAHVKKILKNGESISVETSKGNFGCNRLVLTAGLGNTVLAPMIGLDQSVRPQKGQIVITEKLDQQIPIPSHLLRQTDEGGLMIGDSHEEAGFDISVKPETISGIADRAIATLPNLANVRVVRSWAALRVMPKDGYPIYDQSKTIPGAFAIACHSGVTLAAAHAFDLAGYIAEARLGPELLPFSEQRFHV